MKEKVSIKTVLIIVVAVLVLVVILFFATHKLETVNYEGNEKAQNMDSYLFQSALDKNPIVFWVKNTLMTHPEIPFVEQYEIDMKSISEVTIRVYEKSIIGYIQYMGQYMYFDKDGIVVEVTTEAVEHVTFVEGIRFDRIVMNDKIPVDDNDTFTTILAVTQLIENFHIAVDKVMIDKDLAVTLYLDQVRVELGQNDKTLSSKMADLSNIAKDMVNEPGVLDMKQYSTNDKGYTFKRD